MNRKDTLAIIAAIDRALSVFEGNPSPLASDARVYDELKRIRAELDRPEATHLPGRPEE